jgi:diguanylate cyclase (GGDEF)-like protein
VSKPTRRAERDGSTPDPRIRRSWWIFAATILLLGLILLARLLADGARPLDWVVAALVALVAIAAIRHREAVTELEIGRRAEAESFARILSGLSRSVSEDAIVGAIAEELASSTGADHIVIARRRPEARALQATLISSHPGAPPTTTLLPMTDLDETNMRAAREPVAIPVARGSVAGASIAVAAGSGGVAEMTGGVSRGTPRVVSDVRGPGWRSRGETALTDISNRLTGDGGRYAGARHFRGTEGATSLDADAAQVVADRIAEHVRGAFGLTHMLAAPFGSPDGVIGAIVLSRRSSEPWPATTRRLITGAAVEASAALSRAGSHRAAEMEASTDALTGLPNRRYFDEFCGLLARRRRAEDAVGVLMIDIDRFKILNDTYGHASGDEVLRAVGSAIVQAVRDDDVPARFGGEEFVVLLRNPTGPVALEIGERVRAAVEALDLSRLGIPGVTVSVGAAVAGRQDQPIADLIEEADRALYRAKRGGRNRVVSA